MSNVKEDGMEKGEQNAAAEAAAAAQTGSGNGAGSPTTAKRRGSRSTWMLLIGIGTIGAIALIVGLSVGLTRNRSPTPATVPEPMPATPTSSPPEPSAPSSTSTVGTDTVPTEPGELTTNTGVLEARMTTISSDISRGYENLTEFAKDLTEACKFLSTSVILHDAGEKGYYERHEWGFGFEFAVADGGFDESASDTTESGSPSAGGVTDYGTVNQEVGVDEADLVKANENYVFLVYGDMLVVYESASGVLVTNVTMPPVEQDPTVGGGGGPEEAPAEVKSSIYWGPTKPQIKALMLDGGNLVCVTGGYSGSSFGSGGRGEDKIFRGIDDTLIRIYDISSLGTTSELALTNEKYVSGGYNAGRSVGDHAHLVTTSDINFWPLVGHLRRWNGEFRDAKDVEEYKATAMAKANETIPAFVTQFIDEMGATDESVRNLFRLALWDTATGDEASKTVNKVHGGVVFSGYTQITSFEMSDEGNDLELSTSGAFIPSAWGETYSTKDMMIFAGNGYGWSEEGYVEKTYLLGFKLETDAALSSPAAVGAVPGRILDQYSVSIFDGHLRVGTTTRLFWRWWEDTVVDEDESSTQNQIIILEIPDVESTNEAVFKEVNRLDDLGKKDESITTMRMYENLAYAVTFRFTDPFYVLDLDPSDPQILEELNITGFSSQLYPLNDEKTLLVSLGFEADGGGRTTGFAVSLFDSSDPTDPTLVDRFIVEDDDDVWSSSEGAWDTKAARLVSIGDETGIFIVPLSIYQPWPATEGNFDGFVAYDVNRTHITERLRVPHVRSEDFYECYYPAYLAPRSVVYDGNMHTMKGHSVLSTNLDTGENMFDLSLYKPQINSEECVYWIFEE